MHYNGPLTTAELQDARNTLKQVQIWEDKRAKNLLKAQKQSLVLKDRINMKYIVAVHLTNYFPKNGTIKTSGQHKIDYMGMQVKFPRHSIHFALNGPVGSHMYGNWDGAKYAILVPLNKIASRIVVLNPVDTWVVGELKLPIGSEVLSLKENLKNKKPGKTKLITIEGDLHQAVKQRIIEKGLAPADIGMWAWSFESEFFALATRTITGGLNPLNKFDGGDFTDLSEKLGYDTVPHTYHLLNEIEDQIKRVLSDISNVKKGKIDDYMKRSYSRREESILYEKIKQLEEFIKVREKLPQSKREIEALEHIKKVLEHCIQEEKFLYHYCQNRNNELYKEIKSISKLGDKEKKWLIREYLLVKNIKEMIADHDLKKSRKLVKKISRIEKRVYNKYQTFKDKLNELSQNKDFVVDVSDIINEMDVGEAVLAKWLSKVVIDGPHFTSTIKEDLEKGNWKKVEEKIGDCEYWLIILEKMIEDLHKLLEARYKKHVENF